MDRLLVMATILFGLLLGCQKAYESRDATGMDLLTLTNGECLDITRLHAYMNSPNYRPYYRSYTKSLTTSKSLNDKRYSELARRMFHYREGGYEATDEFSNFSQDACNTVRYQWNSENAEEFKIEKASNETLVFRSSDGNGYEIQVLSSSEIEITYFFKTQVILSCGEFNKELEIAVSTKYSFGSSAEALPKFEYISKKLVERLGAATERSASLSFLRLGEFIEISGPELAAINERLRQELHEVCD